MKRMDVVMKNALSHMKDIAGHLLDLQNYGNSSKQASGWCREHGTASCNTSTSEGRNAHVCRLLTLSTDSSRKSSAPITQLAVGLQQSADRKLTNRKKPVSLGEITSCRQTVHSGTPLSLCALFPLHHSKRSLNSWSSTVDPSHHGRNLFQLVLSGRGTRD